MRSIIQAVVLAVSLCVILTACGPRDGRYDHWSFHYPKMQLVPPDVTNAVANQGIFNVDSSALITDVCCWIGRDAQMGVLKRSQSRMLELSTYMPDELLRIRPQALTISIGREKYRRFVPIVGVSHVYCITLPISLRRATGVIPVTIHAKSSYSGAGDPRKLAIILNAIYFADTCARTTS